MNKLVLHGEEDVNCYFIEYNHKCFIVDPGYSPDIIRKYVQDKGLEVLGILLTHGHADHISAIDCFEVPVYVYKDEYNLLVDTYNNVFSRYGRKMSYSLDDINIVKIDESKVFSIDDKEITVILTPGHTAGGVSYKFGNDLYTGDTLFKGRVGKWIFPTGDLNSMKKSIISLIDTQDENVRVHPGHYDSSTIGEEKTSNPFYLEWKNSI